MSIPDIISTYKDFGYGGLLLVLVVLSVRYLLKENKKCYDKYEAQLLMHREEITGMTERMFHVLEAHTKANINLNNTIQQVFKVLGGSNGVSGGDDDS